MITLYTSTIEIDKIKALITQRIKHTYLNKHIKMPVIDEVKLSVLVNIINNTSLPESTRTQYIITTMLVQIALDTHDLVPETHTTDVEDESSITSKQLKVLSGDYYSALYYSLLAEIEDVKMIHILALAIKEINECKMQLYYKEIVSFNEYISIIEKIESLLFVHVAQFVSNSMINEVTGKLIITNKLIQEKINFEANDSTPILDDWLAYSTNSTYPAILNKVESIIQNNTEKMQTLLSQPTLRISVFKTHFQPMLNKLIYNSNHNVSVAEEG